MHASRRQALPRHRAPARRGATEGTWFRLRTREWDFFVCSDVEAFAVIARHDVIDVEQIGPG